MGRRILVILDSFNQGGAERQAVNLIQGIQSTHEPHVLALQNNKGPIAAQLDALEVTYSMVGLESFWGGYKVLLKNLLRTRFAIRNVRPDFILPYTFYPNLYANAVWKYTGAKGCVWNQRDGGIGFSGGRIERWSLRQTSNFISNSQEGKDYLVNQQGIQASKIQLIHNGVTLGTPTLSRQQLEEKYPALRGRKWIAMVANLHSLKNHDTLIKAWAQVDPEIRKEHLIILAGKPMGTETALAELANSLGVSSTVVQLGEVKEIPSLLAEIEFGVHFSPKEGLPNAVLEMMYQKKAVIASNITGCQEALGEQYPYLFDDPDQKKIAQALTSFISSESERATLGAQNHDRVTNQFSLEKMVNQTRQILDTV